MHSLDQATVAAINVRRFVHFAKQQLLSPSIEPNDKHRLEANLRVYEDNIKLGALNEVSVEVRSALVSELNELRRLLRETPSTERAVLSDSNNIASVEEVLIREEKQHLFPEIENKSEIPSDGATDGLAAGDIPSLLLQQQSMLSQDREQERRAQIAIANELSELTSLLKESTQAMSDAVARQNIDLAALQSAAEENTEELATQKKIMQKQENASTMNFMSTIAMLVFLFISFIATYFVIRFVPSS